jgi:hypothetical protein
MFNPLKTDPAFAGIIPPLCPEEYRQLEENLLSEGRCREPIFTWRGTIIDGHNRYAICQKHGIPFDTTPIHFSNKNEATLWIVNNQLSRRNLTDAARIELATRKAAFQPGVKRKNIARAAGVSEQTVYRYMKIKEIADPHLLKQVQDGTTKIHAAYKMLEVETKTVTTLFEDKYATEIYKSVDWIKRIYTLLIENRRFIA